MLEVNGIDEEIKLYNGCKFCEIYDSNMVKDISDIILYENKNFFIIPALGCLVNNYIMVISKRHISSMCYLNDLEKKELEILLNDLRSMFRHKFGFYPIIFEHGASDCDVNKSSCCILHAHLHIVPYKMNNQLEMISRLNMTHLNDFVEFFDKGYNIPYLLYMDNSGEIYFANCINEVFPSQIIRKWIAKDIGKTDAWDWRSNPFYENIETTVDELKPLIKKSIKKGDYRLKYVYYCRAMDGLNTKEIEEEYNYVQNKLAEQGRILVNPFVKTEHKILKLNKINAELTVKENLSGISRADCVVVNLSIKNHLYVGCIAEMVYAKERGCYVIVITGDSEVEKHFYTIYHADKIYHDLDELFCKKDWR